MNAGEINRSHERAMDLAEAAVIARTVGDKELAQTRFREALELAAEAAARIAPLAGEEPMRGVVHRSAASLALNCGEYRTAEKLLAAGLSGAPPPKSPTSCATCWSRSTPAASCWRCKPRGGQCCRRVRGRG